MTEYDDFRLEDAEDAAMKKSQMAKRVILGGAAAAAIGGTAFAAMPGDDTEAADQNSVDGGMDAGAISEDVLDPAAQPKTVTNNNYHTDETRIIVEEPETEGKTEEAAPEAEENVIEEETGKVTEEETREEGEEETQKVVEEDIKEVEDQPIEEQVDPATEPNVEINESTIIIDHETGEYVGGYDTGTIDGKTFSIVDQDGDGIADIMMYDENGNNVIEDNEISEIGDETNIMIGNSDNVSVVTTEELLGDNTGETGVAQIQNDYYTEEYDDLAHNNPDYNNNVEFTDPQETPDPTANEYLADDTLTDDSLTDDLGSVDLV